MKTMLALALALSVFAGCKKGGSAASQCSDAVTKSVDKMIASRKQRLDEQGSNLPPELKARMEERSKKMDEVSGALKQAMTNRCTEDKWSADVLKCYEGAGSMEDIRKCRGMLPADQAQKLQAEEMQVMMKAMGGQPGMGGPGMGSMPGHPDMGGDPMHGAPGQNGAAPAVPPTAPGSAVIEGSAGSAAR
jgi:hypothetical protein